MNANVIAHIIYYIIMFIIGMVLPISDIRPNNWQYWVVMFSVIGAFLCGTASK